MSMSYVSHPFAPVFDEQSRLPVLGTMPSVQSRDAGFYYAHPRNRFWPVLAACFGQPLPESIAEKTRMLLANGIALWDILASCEIIGSDDSSIRSPVHNDITALVQGKSIAKILCNGKKAYNLCRQLDLPLPLLCMPSTSPANASWQLERLTAAWRSELT